jgi:hypothetical protein
MAKEKLVLLKGFNPDGVRGLVVRPTRDCAVYVVPERGLEVLDVLIDGEPALWRNPAGHRARLSWQGAGLGPLVCIEAGFTGGLENAGAPNGLLPLHGTFSVTPALDWRRTRSGGVSGAVDCRRLVVGPNIVVERSVEPVKGRRAFRYIDRLTALVASDYMWLYHPNFPVEEGTTFVSSETQVVPRPDGIAEKGLKSYRDFENVGAGCARFPPGTGGAAVEAENFEKCFIMRLQPDAAGQVRAMLLAPEGDSAAYVTYNVNSLPTEQRAFQLWKNPRDGVSGLEVGSTFMGWSYAAEHGLLSHLRTNETRTYEIEIGFLRGRREVEAFGAAMPKVAAAELKTLDAAALAKVYRGA